MIRGPSANDALRSVRRSALLVRVVAALAVTVGVRSAVFLKHHAVGRLKRRLTALYGGFDRVVPTPLASTSSSPGPTETDRASADRSSLPEATTRSEITDCGFTPVEYVRRVLREHGGRMRQRRFVDEYGWTPATSSRLLSELEEEGHVVRYRRGREKIVCLPDAVPEGDRRRAPFRTDPPSAATRSERRSRRVPADSR